MGRCCKILFSLFILFQLFSCQKKEDSTKIYLKAVKKDSVALLTLNIGENYFFGNYKVKYGNSGEDSGKVRGTKVGDTLKGRFNFISYGGSEQIIPFVLLKQDKIFKEGSGLKLTYMKIPYYDPETLQFKDSDFHFQQIDFETAKKLNFALD